MKKITYIIDNLLVGGAQVHLVRLADSLRNKNCDIRIISLGDIDNNFKNSGLSIQAVKMNCIWEFGFWINFVKLIFILKKERPDIVHTYLNTSNVFGVFAARLAGVPKVLSSRRDLGHFRSKIIGFLEKISAALSDKVVCVSDAVKNNEIKNEDISEEKLTVIYNGVDTDKFIPPPVSSLKSNTLTRGAGFSNHRISFNVAMVATMNRVTKGHSYFIEAAALVLKERKDVKFTLIGDGPLKESLELRVRSLGLEKNIIFLGQRDDLHKELSNVDIIVVPSESEGCSNALLEAMAMGIAPIATAVEGNLEVIENNVSGLLVEPRNSAAIAEKILYLVNNPERIKEIGINARKRAEEKFSLKQMVDNYAALYAGLTNPKIGYVVSLFPCWSETFILNEIISLDKKGADITIFSIRNDKENFTQEKAKPYLKKTKYANFFKCIVYCGLSIATKPITFFTILLTTLTKRYLNLKTASKYIWCIFVGCYFAKIARKQKITHLHAHFASYPAFCAMVISKLTGIPFSFTAHAHDIFLDKPLLKEISQEAQKIVAISEYNKHCISDYCKNGVASKIQVIHCGIDIKDYLPKNNSNDENVIVSIGRLTKMKGFEYLITALSHIKDTPFKCYIIGDGPLRQKLEDSVKMLELENSVFFIGILDNNKVKEMLAKANLCVLASVWDDEDGQDGIPLVLMEAMALGVPVISSRISGIPELIKDGETGLLTEPGKEEDLSEKIKLLLNNEKQRKQFATQAKLTIERDFNIEKTTDSLIEVFKHY